MALLTFGIKREQPPDGTGGIESAGRRLFLKWLLAVSLLWAGASSQVHAQDPSYRIKAVFLYNFAQFVTWPESAFKDPKAPLVIGILGKDPFGSILDETVRNEVVNGRKLEVRRYRTIEEVSDCQILFISTSEQPRLLEVLQALEGRPILTVGETDNFAVNGGMIRFSPVQNKIRFRINPIAAEKAGLSISSKLLRLADLVETKRSSL